MQIKQIDRTEFIKEVKGADWREDLKHVEPAKDASAPKIEGIVVSFFCFMLRLRLLTNNRAAGVQVKKLDRQGLLSEVKDTDWREDLKHVEPAKDASAPAIPGMIT